VEAIGLVFGYPAFVHWSCYKEPNYHGLLQVVKLWVDVPKIDDRGGAFAGRLMELGRLQPRKKSRIVLGMKCLSCGYTNSMKFILHDDRIFTYAGKPAIKSEFKNPPKTRILSEKWQFHNIQIPVTIDSEGKHASISVDLDMSRYMLTNRAKQQIVDKCTRTPEAELIGPTPYTFSIKLPRSKLSSMKNWLRSLLEQSDSLIPDPRFSEDWIAKLIQAHQRTDEPAPRKDNDFK